MGAFTVPLLGANNAKEPLLLSKMALSSAIVPEAASLSFRTPANTVILSVAVKLMELVCSQSSVPSNRRYGLNPVVS